MKAETPDTQARRYWRSLDRLLDSPAVQEGLGEFPAGASDAPTELDRRHLLKIMGASFALVSLSGCRRPEEAIVPFAEPPETALPGTPKRYATTMPFGTSAHGLVVESHEGRPTKVEGNGLHPSSAGASSAWQQAAILGLYDPDRSTHVLRRGEEGQAPATWEDFAAFWEEVRAAAGQGAGLAVVTESYASPTLARLAAEFQSRFPRARWATWEPVSDENAFRGAELATGTASRPVYRFERAQTILALEADLFGTESESVAHARGFADGRRVDSTDDGMNRLYAVESTPTLTGAMADHRVRLPNRLIPAFAAAVAAELGVPGVSASGLPADAAEKARAVAADLRAVGEVGLVVAGRSLSREVHATVLAINHALGSIGHTVTLHPLRDVARCAGLAELAEAMRGGEVSTLIVLGGNPAYDAPADTGFAEVFGAVEHTVHLAGDVNETSRLCEWHLPRAHFLEAWGDARAADGTLSVVQPLIAPLFGGKSDAEMLATLAGAEASGYELVRETWKGLLGGGSADGGDAGGSGDTASWEGAWRKVLHDGVAAGTALAPVEVAAASAAGSPAAGDGLEVTFQVCRSVYDGRFANVGWLQEMPDPMTKLVWDNAALVSPATAAAHDLEDGDVVKLGFRGMEIEAPVLRMPGQADDSVALALGYGRTAAGRVGDGVGVDAYKLRPADAPWGGTGLTLARAGRSHELVQTQEHWTLEGRPLLREASLGEYREKPDFASAPDAALHLESLWQEPSYAEGYQWGMAIDLNVCTGCNACAVACQSENNVPIVGKEQVSRGREMHWLRVDRYYAGDENEPELAFQPVPCMHCENAPCEQVCPVAATVHDREGINAMVYNRCIGTRYCSNNCPYKVRRFNFFNYTKDTPELLKLAANPNVTVRSRGVMEKCTYCIQRINDAKLTAKKELRTVRDGEIVTACQQACPTRAISFGNIADPESAVARAKAQDRDYVMLAELNNKPRTSYLARLRNPSPDWPGAKGYGAEGHGSTESASEGPSAHA